MNIGPCKLVMIHKVVIKHLIYKLCDNTFELKSPMVGTFYIAPAPDADPYTKVGDHVSVGQTLCIVEAMKLMNEIEADVAGRIVEILGVNEKPVEFGQGLFLIDPKG